MVIWLGLPVNVGKWGQPDYRRHAKCLETGREKLFPIRPHRVYRAIEEKLARAEKAASQ